MIGAELPTCVRGAGYARTLVLNHSALLAMNPQRKHAINSTGDVLQNGILSYRLLR